MLHFIKLQERAIKNLAAFIALIAARGHITHALHIFMYSNVTAM